jgi:hypothetical protein
VSEMQNTITGNESACEILRLALKAVAHKQRSNHHLAVENRDGIPYLSFQAELKNNRGAFECSYRLDGMAQQLFASSQDVYEEFERELFGFGDRERVIRFLAFNAIYAELEGLVSNQIAIMDETFDESVLLTAGILYKSLAMAGDDKLKFACTQQAAKLRQKALKTSSKRKGDRLTRALNAGGFLRLSISGRPTGPSQNRPVYSKSDLIVRLTRAIRQAYEGSGQTNKEAVARVLCYPNGKLLFRDLKRYGILTKERNWRVLIRDICDAVLE